MVALTGQRSRERRLGRRSTCEDGSRMKLDIDIMMRRTLKEALEGTEPWHLARMKHKSETSFLSDRESRATKSLASRRATMSHWMHSFETERMRVCITANAEVPSQC